MRFLRGRGSVWEGITESCGKNEYTHWILPYCKKLRHNNINTNSCGLGLEWFAGSYPVSCRIVWVCARIECKVTRSITIFAVHEDSCQLPPELNRMSKWWDSCTTKPQHSIPVRQKCSVTRTNLRNCSSMSHEIDTHPLCKCTRKLLPLLQLLKVVVVVDDGDIGNWFPWVGLLLYRRWVGWICSPGMGVFMLNSNWGRSIWGSNFAFSISVDTLSTNVHLHVVSVFSLCGIGKYHRVRPRFVWSKKRVNLIGVYGAQFVLIGLNEHTMEWHLEIVRRCTG